MCRALSKLALLSSSESETFSQVASYAEQLIHHYHGLGQRLEGKDLGQIVKEGEALYTAWQQNTQQVTVAPSAMGQQLAPAAGGQYVTMAPAAMGQHMASAAMGQYVTMAPAAMSQQVTMAPAAMGQHVASAAMGQQVTMAPDAMGQPVTTAPSVVHQQAPAQSHVQTGFPASPTSVRVSMEIEANIETAPDGKKYLKGEQSTRWLRRATSGGHDDWQLLGATKDVLYSPSGKICVPVGQVLPPPGQSAAPWPEVYPAVPAGVGQVEPATPLQPVAAEAGLATSSGSEVGGVGQVAQSLGPLAAEVGQPELAISDQVVAAASGQGQPDGQHGQAASGVGGGSLAAWAKGKAKAKASMPPARS